MRRYMAGHRARLTVKHKRAGTVLSRGRLPR
jgi:hypothetical protein